MALTKITPQMFDTSAAGHDFNIDNGTFVVDASANRVGIGTATPSTLLHVDGTATATTFVGALTGNVTGNVSGTAATVTGAAQSNITSVGTLTGLNTTGDITVTKSSARVKAIESGGATTQISSGGSTGYVGTYSNHPLQILSNSTTAITIDTSQNATFAGTVLPASDSAYNIGANATRFANAYFDTVYGTVGTAAQPNITSLGTLTGLTVSATNILFDSNTYNILEVRTDANNDGSSDDGIIKITNSSSSTTKAEFRWDESEDTVQLAYGDHGRHIVINSSGNVGIGTTSPDRNFHVETGGDSYLRVSGNRGNSNDLHIGNIEFENTNGSNGVIAEMRAITGSSGTQNTKGQLAFHTDDGSTYAERMRIDSSGNVGIGVTPSAPLDVHGANNTTFASSAAGNPANLFLAGTNGYNSGYAGSGILFGGRYHSNGSHTTFGIVSGIKENTTDAEYGGALTFMTRTHGQGAGNRERMRIDSTGNVGIGTTNPVAQFAVGGAGRRIEIQGTDGVIRGFDRTSSWAQIDFEAASYTFDTGGTLRMTMDSFGNVGIGTSPATGIGAPLQLGSSTGYVGIRLNGSGSAAVWDLYSSYSGGVSFFGIYDRANTRYNLVATQNNRIGIGTETPTGKLHIVEGNNYAKFGDFHSNSTMTLQMSDTSTHPVEIQAYGSELRFNTSTSANATPSTKMTINAAGTIIGKGIPQQWNAVQASAGANVSTTGDELSSLQGVLMNQFTVTTYGSAKVLIWYDSGQIAFSSYGSQNPQIAIYQNTGSSGGRGSRINRDHNHDWYPISSGPSRIQVTGQVQTATLSAGTYTFSMYGGVYNGGGSVTAYYNYQGTSRGSVMLYTVVGV